MALNPMSIACLLHKWLNHRQIALAPPNFKFFRFGIECGPFLQTITTTNFSTTTSTKASTQSQPLTSGDSIRASVGHLLTRAFSLPCSRAAMAVAQLVQPNSQIQLALDALLPILYSNKPAEVDIGFC